MLDSWCITVLIKVACLLPEVHDSSHLMFKVIDPVIPWYSNGLELLNQDIQFLIKFWLQSGVVLGDLYWQNKRQSGWNQWLWCKFGEIVTSNHCITL